MTEDGEKQFCIEILSGSVDGEVAVTLTVEDGTATAGRALIYTLSCIKIHV